MALALALGGALPAFASEALVIATEPTMVPRELFNFVGYTYDLRTSRPADLSCYSSVWDVNLSSPFSDADINAYLSFLRQGRTLYIAGEHSSPDIFVTRNTSIGYALSRFGVAGVSTSAQVQGTLEAGTPIATTPLSFNPFAYLGSSIFLSVGSTGGQYLTRNSDGKGGVVGSAAIWPRGTLPAAPTGSLISVLDQNYYSSTYSPEFGATPDMSNDSGRFARNLVSYAQTKGLLGKLSFGTPAPAIAANVESVVPVVVTNVAGDAITAAEVRIDVAGSASITGASGTGWTCTPGAPYVCRFAGNVSGAGSTTTLNLRVTPAAGSTDTNLTLSGALAINGATIATPSALNTVSSFCPRYGPTKIAPTPPAIRGTVFEDSAGTAASTGTGLAGVGVRLYRDTNGNNVLDAGDALQASTTTDASGNYQFFAPSSGVFFVAADAPTKGLAGVLGEQTWAGGNTIGTNGTGLDVDGAIHAFCVNGLRSGAGACYGGRAAARTAASTDATTEKHVTALRVGTADLGGVNLGFSFNVVTNVNASGQGSLRQFIVNANSGAGGTNPAMRFVPAVPANAGGGGSAYWSVAIGSGGGLPALSADGATIDGRAYLSSDGATRHTTNNVRLGDTSTLVGVGTGAVNLTGVIGPQLELAGPGDASAGAGLTLSGSGQTLRNLAVYGFNPQLVQISAGSATLTQNVIGMTAAQTTPASPSAPPRAAGGFGVGIAGTTTQATLDSNLIGYTTGTAVSLNTSVGTALTVNRNQILAAAYNGAAQAIRVEGTVGALALTRNLITDDRTGYTMVIKPAQLASAVIADNTIQRNTIGMYIGGPTGGTGSYQITSNWISGNQGAGVLIDTSTSRWRISQNAFGDNGGNAIDLAINGPSGNSNACAAAGTGGANGDAARPVLTGAELSGTTLTLTGTYCGTGTYTLEFYKAVSGSGDGGAGEGVLYLGSLTGLTGGTLNRVALNVASLNVGDAVSALAIRTDGAAAGNTSEFATNVNVVSSLDISGSLFEDVAGTAASTGPALAGVGVRLYRDTNGNNVLDAGDALISSSTTDASGNFVLASPGNGTYFVATDAPSKGLPGAMAEQTWAGSNNLGGNGTGFDVVGAVHAFCRTGAQSQSAACYGGRSATTTASGAGPASEKHVIGVRMGAAGVGGLKFGYSFNVVTNVNATGQGSLAQFINNANSGAGGSSPAMRFVPAVPANAGGGGSAYWSIAVSAGASLPTLTATNATIDGRAFLSSDGATRHTTNNARIGDTTTLVGTGSGAVNLSGVTGPQLELAGPGDSSSGAGLILSGSSQTVRNLAIYGFAPQLVQINAGSATLTQNLIGLAAAQASLSTPVAPPRASGGAGVGITGAASQVTLDSNLIGFTVGTAVNLNSTTPTAVTVNRNQIVSAGYNGAAQAVRVEGAVGALTVTRNLITDDRTGYTFVIKPTQMASASIADNTITSNTIGLYVGGPTGGAGSYQILANRIASNQGAGVMIDTTAARWRISQNTFGNNGGNAIDLGANGPSGNTNACNAAGTGGANGDLARPTISKAQLSGTMLSVSGTYCGTGTYTIELYKAASGSGDGGAGEGIVYLGSLTGLTGGDLSGHPLSTSDINVGETLSAIAIRTDGATAGNTSEFSLDTVVASTPTLSPAACPVRINTSASPQNFAAPASGAGRALGATLSGATTATGTVGGLSGWAFANATPQSVTINFTRPVIGLAVSIAGATAGSVTTVTVNGQPLDFTRATLINPYGGQTMTVNGSNPTQLLGAGTAASGGSAQIGIPGSVYSVTISNSGSTGGVVAAVDLDQCGNNANVTGTVFESPAGTPTVTTNGLAGATVRAYLDANGDGKLGTGDTLFTTATTDASGNYTLPLTQATTWMITVDAPTKGLAGAMADQVYAASNTLGSGGNGFDVGGAIHAFCDATTTGTSTPRDASGACYGGRNAGRADAAPGSTNAAAAEHVTGVHTGTADLGGVNFGFSFNVVTNVNASGQGSLAQFITNANSGAAGTNPAMRFVPTVPANGGGGVYWSVAIPAGGTLPALSAAGATIDGRAYLSTDGTTRHTTNSGPIGDTATLVGTGSAAVTLAGVNGPQLEIAAPGDASTGAGLTLTGASQTVRNLALYGYGGGDIVVNGGSATITQNLIGLTAAQAAPTAPAAPGRINLGAGILVSGATTQIVIDSNVIAYTLSHAVQINASAAPAVTLNRNQILQPGYNGNAAALRVDGTVGALTVTRNLMTDDKGGYAVLILPTQLASAQIADNTLTRNTFLGILLGGTAAGGNYQVVANQISGNGGAGIAVSGPASRWKLSQNFFGNNGGNAIDLGANGPSGNTNACTAAGTGGANGDLARPTLTSTELNGTTLTINGSYCGTGTYTLEFYKAVAGGGDVGAGEGVLYLGSLAGLSGGTLSGATLAVNDLAPGDSVSAIAIRTDSGGAGNTSEFATNAIVQSQAALRGAVYEDVAGTALSSGPALSGVAIRLYRDSNNNSVLDAGDALLATTTTDSSGNFSLSTPGTGMYFVAADAPTKGLAGAMAEQTWAGSNNLGSNGTGFDVDGAVHAFCRNGAQSQDGACFGGRSAATTASGATPASEKHVLGVRLGAAGISSLKFGFSFNVVTNVNATGQGSLAQFIANANAGASGGSPAMRFVPAVPANAGGGDSAYWSIVLGAGATLPALSANGATLDGRAYLSSDGTTRQTTNNVRIGDTSTLVGVDSGAVDLAGVIGPQLEIAAPGDTSTGAGLTLTGTGQTVRNLALYGYGAGGIVINGGSATITQSLIGLTAAQATPTAPAAPTRRSLGAGILVSGAPSQVVIDSNLLAYTLSHAIQVSTSGAPTITVNRNQILQPGYNGNAAALRVDGAVGALSVTRNLMTDDKGGYTVLILPTQMASAQIADNTITRNTFLGILLGGTASGGSYQAVANLISGNGGAGIAVISPATRWKLSQNIFGNNGGNAIDLGANGPSGNTNACTAAGTGGANGDLARPTLTNVALVGDRLIVNGSYCGSGTYTLEFYKAVAGGGDVGAGEGVLYLGSLTGLSGGSLANASLPVSNIAAGDAVSAIAIRSDGNTSEFAANAVIQNTADVAITQTWPANVFQGATLSYTLTVSNAGPAAAADLIVTDAALAGFTKTAVSCEVASGAATCPASPTVAQLEGGTLKLPNLGVDGTVVITVTGYLTARSGTTLTHPAQVATSATSGVIDPVQSNNSSSVALTVSGVFVNGTVYRDRPTGTNGTGAPNGALDGDEFWDPSAAQAVYVKAAPRSSGICSAPASAVQIITPGSGAYSLALAPGDYCLLISNNDAVSDVGVSLPASLSPSQPNPALRQVTVTSAGLTQQNFGLVESGGIVTGKVFVDDGRGGGSAGDALVNGGEAGTGGATLAIDNCATQTYATATAANDGSFSLAAPATLTAGAPLCVTVTVASGQSVTGASAATSGGGTVLTVGQAVSVGGVAYTSTRTGARTLRVAWAWPGPGLAPVLQFGVQTPSSFAPDGNGTAPAGGSVTYAHTVRAAIAGNLGFAVGTRTASPSAAWQESIWIDDNCNGQIDSGEALASAPVAVSAGQQVCIVVRVNAPFGLAEGAYESVPVVATLTPAAGTAITLTVTDRTTVQSAAALQLRKDVRNSTTSGSFASANTASSGDVLEYRIVFTNLAATALAQVSIADIVPVNASFVDASAVTIPTGLGNCTKLTPASPATGVACATTQASGGTGVIRWSFDGLLAPAASGELRFRVKID